MRSRKMLAAGIACAATVGAATAWSAPDGAPWRRRYRPDVTPNRMAAKHVSPEDWPEEPESPDTVDPDRFAEALEKLCVWMRPGRPERYTKWVVRYANEFDVDPFLLGALIHRMSRCDPDKEALSGLGLTLIVPRMHWHQIDDDRYRYKVRDDGEWETRFMELDRFPFTRHQLLRAEANLYFAAAFLSVWKKQQDAVHRVFEEQAPHRHYVSHFIWGDRVETDRAEDRALLDRRRLLLYYGAIDRHDPVERKGLTLASPLDGAPRAVSSFMGARREGGERRHRGIDLEADRREPVRALADGMVNFAGVDLPRKKHENMTPEEIKEVPRDKLGAGGRYVCVLHEPDDREWLRSCYMHLADVFVKYGQDVERGERIATVGRTGMDESAPHLHLEMHDPDGLLDPAKVLRGLVIGEPVPIPE